MFCGSVRDRRECGTLNTMCQNAYNIAYVSYETVVLGSPNPINLVETIILNMLKLILVKDRSSIIEREAITNQVRKQFILESSVKNKRNEILRSRWEKINRELGLFH